MRALVRVAGLGRPVAPRLVLAVLAGTGAAAAAVGLTATSAWLISRAAEQPPVLVLFTAVTAVRAFGIGRGVLRYAERLAAHDAAFRVLAELRTAVYARLVVLAPAGLAELRSGDLLARLVGDVDGLADVWLRVLLPATSIGLVAIGSVVLVAWLVPAAGLVLAASLVAVLAGAPLAAAAVARRAEARLAPARGALADAAVEIVRGAPELVATGAAGSVVGRIADLDAGLARAERRVALGAGVGALVGGIAAGAAVWLALVLGIAAVGAGRLDGVALAVVVLTPLTVHELVAPLVTAARQLPGLAAAAARVVDVVDRPDPVPDPVAPVRPPSGPVGLRARALRVRYPGAERDAIAGLDLDVPPGRMAIVTGPSGAGKSTLAAACLRFVAPTSGRIELVGADGPVDLASMTGDDVRRAVALCEQDPHVFDATLADNLRLARPGAPEPALREALAEARLLDWVERLPDGLATTVGEHGSRLSAGQRQRLALARALLAGAPVLILDEPTEHLDEPTAAAFVAELEQALVGRTVLVLTHRPELFVPARWARAGTLDQGVAVADPRSMAT